MLAKKSDKVRILDEIDNLSFKKQNREYQFAPYVLLRYSTLPFNFLEGLRPVDTLQRIEQIAALRCRASSVVDTICDSLYLLVQEIDEHDSGYRRKALQLKREIFAGKKSKLDLTLLNKIRDDLARYDSDTALSSWLKDMDSIETILASIEDGLMAEINGRIRVNLRKALDNSLFLRALMLANPGVSADARKEKSLPTKRIPNSFERSLLSYVIRASAKTSPFSSFMATSPLFVDEETQRVAERTGPKYVFNTRVNRGVVSALAKSLTHAPDTCIKFRSNTTLKHLNGRRYRALCRKDVVIIGRPWQQHNISVFQLDPKVSRVLLRHKDSVQAKEWIKRFSEAGIEEASASKLFQQLNQRGLFTSTPLYDVYNERPEIVLGDLLSKEASLAKVGAKFSEVVSLTEDISSGNTDNLENKLGTIRECETSIQEKLLEKGEQSVQNIVLDDCYYSFDNPSINHKILDKFQDLNDFLCSQISISPLYNNLRERFLSRFGVGGRCDDLKEFLLNDCAVLIDSVEYGEKREALKKKRPASFRLGVTVQAQVVNDKGVERIVVNQVFTGAGWLAARFSTGDYGNQDEFRSRINDWMNTVGGDKEPVTVLINSQSNDLQAHPPLTTRSIVWPDNPDNADDSAFIDLDKLYVKHNEDTGLLDIYDEDDVAVYLCYLGSTLRSPSWGAAYALSILSEPYDLNRPDYAPEKTDEASAVQFRPRRMCGEVIVQRASWWVSVKYLKESWFKPMGSAQIMQVHAECDKHGIPSTVYARRQSAGAGASPSDIINASRKPIWIDLENPFCLYLLQRLCDKQGWVVFSEPLPDGDQLWLDIDGEKHTSEIQIEMLLGQ